MARPSFEGRSARSGTSVASSIETAPGKPNIPRQRIKLEIANIPAHTRELVPLRANYESARAMPTIYVNTESLDEIMADKILAFPTSLLDTLGRPAAPDSTKIRHRDIWDLAWMATRGTWARAASSSNASRCVSIA